MSTSYSATMRRGGGAVAAGGRPPPPAAGRGGGGGGRAAAAGQPRGPQYSIVSLLALLETNTGGYGFCSGLGTTLTRRIRFCSSISPGAPSSRVADIVHSTPSS